MSRLAGRYEIVRQLGGGGFAITFLARDDLQPSKPLCVVKQLRPNHTHPRIVEFFKKEAAILERLGKHPQIPRLLAHFSENQNLYIVQEFIPGQDLSAEIMRGKYLSEDEVIKLIHEVLLILRFVHQQGVIHRDIKPQNIMRRHQDGKIFLIDFGAVKEIASQMVNSQGNITSTVAIGTPGYMPNEQKNGKPCLGSDVYALGMVAIQALTGIMPFDLQEDPQTGEIIWRHHAQVSDHLANVLTKMVRRHYSLRYSGAEEILQALIPSSLTPIDNTPNTARLVLQTFQFQIVTVDVQGKITNRRPSQAKFLTEDLGYGISLEIVEILGGRFAMGSPEGEKERYPNEVPQHSVTIQPFFIGKFAVTQEQYQVITGKNPSKFKGAKRPVESVSWDWAIAFCDQLSHKTGKMYRLPTEAEWEYACRAGTTTPFNFGETITTEITNYEGNYTYGSAPKGQYRQQTTEVGSFPPNAFGLYDMHGNVWEWCQDTYHADYKGAPTDGGAWFNENDHRRIVRGGSWFGTPRLCRSALRNRIARDFRYSFVGFRVVL